MRIILLAAAFIFLNSCQKKTVSEEPKKEKQTTYKKPSDFFPEERAKVLVVGTFHFDYPGLDEHKTDESDQIDVLKEPKSTELSELVEYIKKFNPNKIAIEATPRWNAMKKFNAYKKGAYQDERDERYQIGMKLAEQLQLDTIYSVDQTAISNDLYKKDSLLTKSLFGNIDWEIEDPYWDRAKEWLAYDDQLTKELPMLEYFKYMNSREVQNANFGLYLTGSVATGGNQGADYLSMWWYNRNMRIFTSLINITKSKEDRILVLIGNGHAAILRQLFEASPQYDYIEFDSL